MGESIKKVGKINKKLKNQSKIRNKYVKNQGGESQSTNRGGKVSQKLRGKICQKIGGGGLNKK